MIHLNIGSNLDSKFGNRFDNILFAINYASGHFNRSCDAGQSANDRVVGAGCESCDTTQILL